MLNSKSQAGTKADSEQKDDDMQVSQHSRKLPVVCSLLSYEKQVLDFGLRCYNDGLYDGQMNLKGGESILEKFHAFLASLVEQPP